MDQERASQEEITADERRCTQIRTVNHPTDRAMIGCIPPGSQSRTNFICVHLCASVCICGFHLAFLLLATRAKHTIVWTPASKNGTTDAHRCTQMNCESLDRKRT